MSSIPSGATVIKVTRGGGGEVVKKAAPQEEPEAFVNMQKSMEDEMERRKKDWENEVERLQGDFFNMNTTNQPAQDNEISNLSVSHEKTFGGAKRTPGGVEIVREDALTQSPGGTEIFDLATKNLYNEMPDGTRFFKLRFDLHGFKPNEISVRAEGDKLSVFAKHEEQVGKGGKTARQFNRQVDIPYNVDPDKLESHLSTEGILSVEAPIEEVSRAPTKPAVRVETTVHGHAFPELEPPYMPPGYHSVVHESTTPTYHRSIVRETPGYSRVVRTHTSGSGRPYISHSISPPSNVKPILYQGDPASQYHSVMRSMSPGGGRVVSTTTTTRSSPKMHHKVFNYNKASVDDTEYGRKLRLVVDLGGKYKPEEISLKFVGQKLHLQAKHEEKVGGRTSRCEFSREFDIPEEIEMRTARAMMGDDGKIHVGGSAKENENHDMVLEYVLMDMPSGGKPVPITKE